MKKKRKARKKERQVDVNSVHETPAEDNPESQQDLIGCYSLRAEVCFPGENPSCRQLIPSKRAFP